MLMVDTPELFGGELRILAAIDFVDPAVKGALLGASSA